MGKWTFIHALKTLSSFELFLFSVAVGNIIVFCNVLGLQLGNVLQRGDLWCPGCFLHVPPQLRHQEVDC